MTAEMKNSVGELENKVEEIKAKLQRRKQIRKQENYRARPGSSKTK